MRKLPIAVPEHDALFPRAVPIESPTFQTHRDIAHGIINDLETKRFDEYVNISHLPIVDRYAIMADREPRRKDLVMLAHAAIETMNKELETAEEHELLTA